MGKKTLLKWLSRVLIWVVVGAALGAVAIATFISYDLGTLSAPFGTDKWDFSTLSSESTALAAIITAAVALYIANADKKHRKNEKITTAKNYIISICGDLFRAKSLLNSCGINTREGKISFASRDDYQNALLIISSINVLLIADASQKFSRNIAGVKQTLIMLDEAFRIGGEFKQKTHASDPESENQNGRVPHPFEIVMPRFCACVDASSDLLCGVEDWERSLKK
ncbi:hypothetical protein [Paenalcaligenes suwonensis]|uniref:hypothetical protein n=1 Tax=Paenalcaligenes suwonensis TaxID=1202713 RepID=UPI001407B142|nr:hypothetical protein [Paenalcaligenes suwonensis]NHC62743.1 hypothetical protein [Paenalcaligenes suwonensis]